MAVESTLDANEFAVSVASAFPPTVAVSSVRSTRSALSASAAFT